MKVFFAISLSIRGMYDVLSLREMEPFSLFSRRFIGIHVGNPLTRHDKAAW